MVNADDARRARWRDHHPRLRSVPGICVGGMIGSSVRAGLSFLQSADWAWPWVTFGINMAGSLFLGFLLEFLANTGDDRGRRREFRLFAGTGVIGGFTTYGTFILEADVRLMESHVWIAAAYVVVSVVLGMVCAGIGVAVAHKVSKPRHRREGEAR